jgi:hypothetical protein
MLRAVRFCLMIEGREGVTRDRRLPLAGTAERLGFEALEMPDPLATQGFPKVEG